MASLQELLDRSVTLGAEEKEQLLREFPNLAPEQQERILDLLKNERYLVLSEMFKNNND